MVRRNPVLGGDVGEQGAGSILLAVETLSIATPWIQSMLLRGAHLQRPEGGD